MLGVVIFVNQIMNVGATTFFALSGGSPTVKRFILYQIIGGLFGLGINLTYAGLVRGRFGFILERRAAVGMRFWTGAYWAGIHSWWLMWTFNPHTLRRKRFREMARSDLWMTRDTLLGRYGTGDRRGGLRGA